MYVFADEIGHELVAGGIHVIVQRVKILFVIEGTYIDKLNIIFEILRVLGSV
jgi:hypothetical protein